MSFDTAERAHLDPPDIDEPVMETCEDCGGAWVICEEHVYKSSINGSEYKIDVEFDCPVCEGTGLTEKAEP